MTYRISVGFVFENDVVSGDSLFRRGFSKADDSFTVILENSSHLKKSNFYTWNI